MNTMHYTPVETAGGMPVSANYAAKLADTDHRIPLGEARQMISDFSADILGSYDAFPLCETFNAAAVRALLDAPGTIGLRIYNGIDGDGMASFVLASVNGDGTDLTMNGVSTGLLAEAGLRYPGKWKPWPARDEEV